MQIPFFIFLIRTSGPRIKPSPSCNFKWTPLKLGLLHSQPIIRGCTLHPSSHWLLICVVPLEKKKQFFPHFFVQTMAEIRSQEGSAVQWRQWENSCIVKITRYIKRPVESYFEGAGLVTSLSLVSSKEAFCGILYYKTFVEALA